MDKKKVLIIDDETDFCLLLKSYFSRLQYDVKVAHRLQDGMKLLQNDTPDIVFLDNNLPDGFGWDKADFILTNFPSLQLNLISAYHYDKPKIKLPAVLRIWEKPINLKELGKIFYAW